MKNIYLRLALSISFLFSILAAEAAAPAQVDTVSVVDLVTKVYGVFPADIQSSEMLALANARNLSPIADESGVWLDSDDSFSLCYEGMTPEVNARAEYIAGTLDNFGYFFLFPYSCPETKAEANAEQCEFCGALLQEMADMGMDMGADPATERIFEAVGSYAGNLVEVSLVDDGNRYIVMLSVAPGAYFPADDATASLTASLH